MRGISEIILKHGDIQVDFADVRTIMAQGGDALMGMGRASGENKATVAADRAIHSPLLDNVNIAGATGVLVNITGGEDLGLTDVNDAMNAIYEAVGTSVQANIIFGTVVNPDLHDEIAITVIATGFANSTGSKSSLGGLKDGFRRTGSVSLTPRLSSNAEGARVPEFSESTDDLGKVPFAARASLRPSNLRAEEDADTVTRKGVFSNPFSSRGRILDAEPDIDYETPAFLRNQAD